MSEACERDAVARQLADFLQVDQCEDREERSAGLLIAGLAAHGARLLELSQFCGRPVQWVHAALCRLRKQRLLCDGRLVVETPWTVPPSDAALTEAAVFVLVVLGLVEAVRDEEAKP